MLPMKEKYVDIYLAHISRRALFWIIWFDSTLLYSIAGVSPYVLVLTNIVLLAIMRFLVNHYNSGEAIMHKVFIGKIIPAIPTSPPSTVIMKRSFFSSEIDSPVKIERKDMIVPPQGYEQRDENKI